MWISKRHTYTAAKEWEQLVNITVKAARVDTMGFRSWTACIQASFTFRNRCPNALFQFVLGLPCPLLRLEHPSQGLLWYRCSFILNTCIQSHRSLVFLIMLSIFGQCFVPSDISLTLLRLYFSVLLLMWYFHGNTSSTIPSASYTTLWPMTCVTESAPATISVSAHLLLLLTVVRRTIRQTVGQ